MSDSVLMAVISVVGIMNTGALALMFRINYRLAQLNGSVARHERLYKACPLCPDKWEK